MLEKKTRYANFISSSLSKMAPIRRQAKIYLSLMHEYYCLVDLAKFSVVQVVFFSSIKIPTQFLTYFCLVSTANVILALQLLRTIIQPLETVVIYLNYTLSLEFLSNQLHVLNQYQLDFQSLIKKFVQETLWQLSVLPVYSILIGFVNNNSNKNS